MNDTINKINESLIERYKLLHEILENQFAYLKEKYEAEVKLNILQIQKDSVSNIINDLVSQKEKLLPSTSETNKDQKLVTKSSFNMQPTISSKTNE